MNSPPLLVHCGDGCERAWWEGVETSISGHYLLTSPTSLALITQTTSEEGQTRCQEHQRPDGRQKCLICGVSSHSLFLI